METYEPVMKSIAAVIVTYNRKSLLLEAVQSLINQSYPIKKIIVVDNHSTDESEEFINQNLNDSDKAFVEYHFLNENLGGSAGFYEGVSFALKGKYDWVSLSDDDAIFDRDYFANLMEIHEQHPEIKALSGGVWLPSGHIDGPHREYLKNEETFSVEEAPEEKYNGNFFYDIFSFCGIVLSTDVIRKIGLPEKDYFIRFDDFEYALRTRKITKILNVGKAVIHHKTNDFGHNIAPWKEYYVTRNRIAMTMKHTNSKFKAHLYFQYVMARKLLAMLVVKNRRSQLHYLMRAYVEGYHDGYHNNLGRNDAFLP